MRLLLFIAGLSLLLYVSAFGQGTIQDTSLVPNNSCWTMPRYWIGGGGADFTLGSTSLRWGNSGGDSAHASMIFADIAIGQGVVIDSAFIVVRQQGASNGGVAIRAYGINADDPTQVTDTAGFHAQPVTTAHKDTTFGDLAEWPGSGTTGVYWINVTAPLQEIVNRAGFASGNNVGFQIRTSATAGSLFNVYAGCSSAPCGANQRLIIGWHNAAAATTSTTRRHSPSGTLQIHSPASPGTRHRP